MGVQNINVSGKIIIIRHEFVGIKKIIDMIIFFKEHIVIIVFLVTGCGLHSKVRGLFLRGGGGWVRRVWCLWQGEKKEKGTI